MLTRPKGWREGQGRIFLRDELAEGRGLRLRRRRVFPKMLDLREGRD